MRTKVTFLVGFAAGYVLGSRAGRARYEQIRQAARSFLDSPAVASTTASPSTAPPLWSTLTPSPPPPRPERSLQSPMMHP